MTNTDLPLPPALLAGCLRETFGSACRLSSSRFLTGGTRKQVLLLDLQDAGISQVVLLAWHNERDYFNEGSDANSALNDQNAPALYRANTELLLANGLRVPKIYFFDDSRAHVPFAYALVEYVRAVTFHEYQAAHTGEETSPILEKMRAYLERMHNIRRAFPGTALETSPGRLAPPDEELAGALPDLEGLAQVHAGVASRAWTVRMRLEELHRQMAPRSSYTFIHGELGPDEHFLIDEQGQILMLDIDACRFADLEREHAYLRLRFEEYETAFRRADLDPVRMEFYGLCLNIMASYGHYRLLVQGYPGADELRQIYEWNAERVIWRIDGGK